MFAKHSVNKRLALLFGLLLLPNEALVHGITREYFVAIEEIEWDYAPSGRNMLKDVPLEDDEDAAVFCVTSNNTIGRRYKKAVFREYGDSEFAVKSQRHDDWGIIGPPLRAEVGDKMLVHVRNLASRSYSMHPHGVFYNKSQEGALYNDKTTGLDRTDDEIPPGQTYTYDWDVTKDFAPTENDPDCITWAYHSHILSHRDTNTGLIGPMLICKPESLDENGQRKYFNKEFFLLFNIFDENVSWYLDDNIKSYALNPNEIDPEDEDFQESNKMHAINGLMYGNLRGLTVCKGDKISFHLFGFGSELDLHSVHFEGETVEYQGHRTDTIQITPGIFATGVMHADNPGNFEITCRVNDHVIAGMSTTFNVHECENGQQREIVSDATENVREFFIGIQEVDWDYGPSGVDLINKHNLTEKNSQSATFFERGPDRIGGVYKKAVFIEYEAADFLREKRKPPSHGILGPIIALEVGDKAQITLRNFAENQTYNIEPHGVFFNDFSAVEPGETHTYEWRVPESVSPTDLDRDCIAYLYTSSVDSVKDSLSGLVGPMHVCKKGTLERNLERRAVYLLFSVFDENLSHYLEENMQRFTTEPGSIDKDDDDFIESNLMHAINGRMYGNLDVNICAHAETNVHVLGLGTEVDMHSFYMDGLAYLFNNEWKNVLNVLPHTTASTTVIADKVGVGSISCQVFDHLSGGMKTWYTVRDCGLGSGDSEEDLSDGVVRTYYVAVVEQIWDYLSRKNAMTDNDLTEFTKQERGKFIGTKYWKALYHEYTDETFTRRRKKRPHLGFLGPVLSAEEGDTIKIVFKNMATRTYNMVPFGLIPENFLSEGVAAATPGETVTYVWKIPKQAVPAPNKPDCNSHAYVSDVNIVEDMYSGLIGPIIICRKGTLSETGWMKSVDAEFILLFFVSDENSGHYIDKNIREFAEADPENFDKEDEQFVESNLMHGINGRLDHVGGLTMHDGDRVIWHLLGMGNEVDIHTVHFHAHAYNYTTDRLHHGDVFPLFQGVAGTVDMRVNNVGEWLVHCHIDDHMSAGMSTTYTVLPKKSKPPCYARRERTSSRRYLLNCIFENTESLDDFIEKTNRPFEVCVYFSSKHKKTCNKVARLSPSSIYLLKISTHFEMSATAFKELISEFTQLRILYADAIGLKFILPYTFRHNRYIKKIHLRRNKIQSFSTKLFRGLTDLIYADFRSNEVRGRMQKFLAKSAGVKARIISLHDP